LYDIDVVLYTDHDGVHAVGVTDIQFENGEKFRLSSVGLIIHIHQTQTDWTNDSVLVSKDIYNGVNCHLIK
jgi:hypothetical protein